MAKKKIKVSAATASQASQAALPVAVQNSQGGGGAIAGIGFALTAIAAVALGFIIMQNASAGKAELYRQQQALRDAEAELKAFQEEQHNRSLEIIEEMGKLRTLKSGHERNLNTAEKNVRTYEDKIERAQAARSAVVTGIRATTDAETIDVSELSKKLDARMKLRDTLQQEWNEKVEAEVAKLQRAKEHKEAAREETMAAGPDHKLFSLEVKTRRQGDGAKAEIEVRSRDFDHDWKVRVIGGFIGRDNNRNKKLIAAFDEEVMVRRRSTMQVFQKDNISGGAKYYGYLVGMFDHNGELMRMQAYPRSFDEGDFLGWREDIEREARMQELREEAELRALEKAAAGEDAD